VALALSLALLAACAAPAAAPTSAPAAKPTEAAKPAEKAAPAAKPTEAAKPAEKAAPAAKPTDAAKPAAKLAQMTNLKYGATGISWSNSPQIVAIEKKFFEAENLNVEMIVAGQSAAVCQQLLAKAIDVGQCSLNDTIQAVEAGGAPLILVSADLVTSLDYGLMSKPDLKTWADLKGKTIMVAGPRDNTIYFIRTMARANGLQDNDYEFQFAGTSGARFAGLKSGAVDAALLTDPFDQQAETDGFHRMDDLLPKYVTAENYAGGGVIAQRDWAREHPNEIAAYSRATRRAVQWIYAPANKDELFAIMQPRLNVTREAFDNSYRKTVIQNKMWTTDGLAKESAVQGVVNSLVELGSLPAPAPKADKYFDNTYVELALRSS
jgi:ABC-type nitrate/sulfonate/bicarbonate transport system substrate-binding protein